MCIQCLGCNIRILHRARDERLSLFLYRAGVVPFQGTDFARKRNSIIAIVEQLPTDRMALPGKIRYDFAQAFQSRVPSSVYMAEVSADPAGSGAESREIGRK